MAAILQKAYNGALDVARILAKSTILKHLGIIISHKEGSQPWHMNGEDLSLIASQNNSNCNMEQTPSLPSEPGARSKSERLKSDDDERLSEPIFTDGEPTVIVARNEEGQLCFTVSLTTLMLEWFNDASQDKQNRESKLETLAKLENKEMALRQILSDQSEKETEASPRMTAIKQELEELAGIKESFNNQIWIYNNNLRSYKDDIYEAVEEALKSAALLNPVQIPKDRRFDTEDFLNGGLDAATPYIQQEVKLTEEEQTKENARRAYKNAKEHYISVQGHFDSMETYAEEDIQAYREALAQGTAKESQTEHDLHVLQCKMSMTSDLVEAEMSMNEAKQAAEKLGVLDECEDDDDSMDWDCGQSVQTNRELPAGLDPDQTDIHDFQRPMTEGERVRVDRWLGQVDEEADPESASIPAESMLDDWRPHEPEMHESLSVVDYGPLGQQIGQWQMVCEAQRKQWREDFPTGSPREKFGHPLKRRMSL